MVNFLRSTGADGGGGDGSDTCEVSTLLPSPAAADVLGPDCKKGKDVVCVGKLNIMAGKP